MSKKVLFLVNHDVVIYNFRKELVERLIEEGYEVIISSPYGPKIDELINMGCVYSEIDIERHGTNPLQDKELYKYYKKIIKKHRPDVVLTYTIKPNIYGAMAAKKYGISCIANITGLGTAFGKKGIIQKFLILLYKISFSKIYKVFFQNKEDMNFFKEKKIALGKYGLLPGSGVNTTYFNYLDYPRSKKIKFVFISRVMKEKGIEEFLEAAEVINKKYPNTEFHICGFVEDEYKEKISELSKKEYIIYHGMVSDIRKILENTNCTIHPSYYPEGMSNVLLESASSGRPIISTDRSGCREVVDNGINGFIVKQRNVNSLIEKIELFLKLTYEEKKDMGIAGRIKVEKEFNREIVVKQYLLAINAEIYKA